MFGRRPSRDSGEALRLSQVKRDIAASDAQVVAERMRDEEQLVATIQVWARVAYRTIDLIDQKKIKQSRVRDKVLELDRYHGVGKRGLYTISSGDSRTIDTVKPHERRDFMLAVKAILERYQVDTSELPPFPYPKIAPLPYTANPHVIQVEVIGSDGFPADWARPFG